MVITIGSEVVMVNMIICLGTSSGAVSYHLYVRSSMNLMPPALKVLFQITYIEMMELVCN